MSLKAAVSLGKRRTKDAQLGTDLDLAYLTPTLIAMGFPCPSLPKTLYRNSMSQALKFLDSKHGAGHYFVFNLCSEPGWSYPSNCFHGNYIQYPFDDHQPPPFHLLLQILHHIHTWLQCDPRNIAAVHCKAGKGRTGVVCCAYLLLTRVFEDADAVLAGYTRLRMLEGWGEGLTVAGQVRWVRYFDEVIKKGGVGEMVEMEVRRGEVQVLQESGKLRWRSGPENGDAVFGVYQAIQRTVSKIGLRGVSRPQDVIFEIASNDGIVWSSVGINPQIVETQICFTPTESLKLEGDVCIYVYLSTKRRRICRAWFNTFFIGTAIHPRNQILLQKLDVDGWKRYRGVDPSVFEIAIDFEALL